MKSYKPFPETMSMLLEMEGISTREMHRRGVRKGWGVSQATANRLTTGDSEVSPEHMEAIARALNVAPETFLEYRLWRVRREYDPKEVGFSRASANLKRLERGEDAVEKDEEIPPADLIGDEAGPGDQAASS